MPGVRRVLLLLIVLAASVPATAARADTPVAKTLYADGSDGRFLLGGPWLFRPDPGDGGEGAGWFRDTGTADWSPITVPRAWNLGDDSPASMAGGVGWYRKDFELPSRSAALQWLVRFESVNYIAKVWLNGRAVGTHRGAYLPFEFVLAGLVRSGTNRLVVRVDSRRARDDFPPSGVSQTGVPAGGWWNYSGILREVYLRRVDTVDFEQVVVRPQLACRTCAARVTMVARVRNATRRSRSVTVTGRYGGRPVALGTRRLRPGATVRFAGGLTLRSPRLWSPRSPALYRAVLAARVRGRRVARYHLHSGIKSVRVRRDGRLLLNGHTVHLRGVGYHEDDRENGSAIGSETRARLIAETKALGATLMRTHYPPHPELQELADREGILLWSEIPVYSVGSDQLDRPGVRARAVRELARNIEANQNHASVLLWSVGNELNAKPGPGIGAYFRQAARRAHRLDPTRPVAYATASYLSAGCQRRYAPLDVIGFNEYFGWYTGPGGQIFDRTRLSGYLDSIRRCYPHQALLVSEFGAEANRDGPAEEKGTWAFQQDFVRYHLGVFATKPWLNGAIYWALNEFRVRPGWEGGNPRPASPLHQKGLLRYGTWERKPAWADVQRLFKGVKQFG
jgi:beta-glucuronidase